METSFYGSRSFCKKVRYRYQNPRKGKVCPAQGDNIFTEEWSLVKNLSKIDKPVIGPLPKTEQILMFALFSARIAVITPRNSFFKTST
jgi:hypothetical protein